MDSKSNKDDHFVLEYLYLEDYYIQESKQTQNKEKIEEENDRGVIIIDLW